MINTDNRNIKGLLLNGGQSSRMGEDKAKLMLGTITLKQHMLELFQRVGIEDVVISGEHVADRFKQQGPLAGIEAVLTAYPDNDWLVLPIDMPQLSPALLTRLIEQAQFTQTCAHFDASVMPLYIHKATNGLGAARASLTSSSHRDWAIRSWLSKLACERIDSGDDKQLQNLNTPQQWQEYVSNL